MRDRPELPYLPYSTIGVRARLLDWMPQSMSVDLGYLIHRPQRFAGLMPGWNGGTRFWLNHLKWLIAKKGRSS